MPNLTAKELAGISDQLNFEKVLCAKYQTAVQETEDQELKTSFQQYADQHRQNFDCLLNFLK
ncbi:MAG: spore coat protein [Oscillospiraceae bacterium]|nr:spore coat protein [Oscillospiraceae bacterium]